MKQFHKKSVCSRLGSAVLLIVSKNTVLFIVFYIFLAAPLRMWDLSFPTRNRLAPSALEAWSLNPRTTREVSLIPNYGHYLG